MFEEELERSGLLKFVPPNISNTATVLVIETAEYLEGLRNLMPFAGIALLSTERTSRLVEVCKHFKANLLIGKIPTEPQIFDIIIAEDCLTFAQDVYGTLKSLNLLLKDSGFLLTQYLNVRFVGVLEVLKLGAFPTRERRLWAKPDVVKMLDDATYKEIRFLPGERINSSAADAWLKFGFDNFSDDLTTKIWLVKACKCEAEVAALKEVFTPEIRAELSRLLHRIEYNIDVADNLDALRKLRREVPIFDEYLSDFIDQVVVHERAAEFIKFQCNL